MKFTISGQNLKVGDALPEHVRTEIGGILDKFGHRPTDASVTFSKRGHEFVCDAAVHLSTGLTVNATGKAAEIYDSFESSAQKMEKQLRRYKRRLKDHHRDRTSPIESQNASSYILASESDMAESDEPESLQPIVIAEMETRIKALSVGEAVMQMELADENVLLFKNEGNDGLNIVYRRKDGNIGWIDPSLGS